MLLQNKNKLPEIIYVYTANKAKQAFSKPWKIFQKLKFENDRKIWKTFIQYFTITLNHRVLNLFEKYIKYKNYK